MVEKTNSIAIDPTVALKETLAEAEAEIAFHKNWNRNRRLILAQENHVLRQTVEAQKAEIEAMKAGGENTEKKKA